MFVLRFVARRLWAWFRLRNPLVARAVLVASALGWLWQRSGRGRVIVLDPREAYSIEVGPPRAFDASDDLRRRPR